VQDMNFRSRLHKNGREAWHGSLRVMQSQLTEQYGQAICWDRRACGALDPPAMSAKRENGSRTTTKTNATS